MTAELACMKCGFDCEENVPACARCGWPFKIEAWKTTTHRIGRITIDKNCINQKGGIPDLNLLERWEREGQIELQKSSALPAEPESNLRRRAKIESIEPHPDLITIGHSPIAGADAIRGPDIEPVIRKILFLTVKDLKQNQQFDVDHLVLHIRTGGDVFLTTDKGDFIAGGKQERLRSVGVWVFEPSDLVRLLRDLYSWN